MTFWEGLAYAITRGIAKAWFEQLAEYQRAQRELFPDAAAQERGGRIADAVDRLPPTDRHP